MSLFWTIIDWTLDHLTPQSLLNIILWLVGWFFVCYLLEFGVVYLMITIIYLIFTNLGKRKKGELSAYSMFNHNFEQITGTFDGEFYDNMLRHGGSSTANLDKTKKNIQQHQSNQNINDPCACDSGKKYKKCCMKNSRQSLIQSTDDYSSD
ncbi:SEC-C motif family protein [Reticulomyxa filosa]|uniref:SEC-C motif family protein n=1 Tax=Reticulomyxa filosa TaxID=46433 RepID=X6PDS6_RETFI|nr:SEC-C motif family protein [Reticulomyxa filosa]|eukprot:ETO36258.1 SEC-C motif family protein [Reticulomyxa filosa]